MRADRLLLALTVALFTAALGRDAFDRWVDATQLPVLAAAATHGPVLMSRLADVLVMDRTTLTRNLQPLLRAGLVAIEKGEDKRTRLVNATDKGVKVLKDALPIWRKTQEEMVDALGRFQWGVLMDNLRATVAAAREKGAE